MDSGHIYDHYRFIVRPALESKLDEFRIHGYDSISVEEFWTFLIRKKWKKAKEEKKLYEIVQEILSVKVSDYLSYNTIESLKKSDFSLDNEAELKELLK
ncbi:post-transcriptional regulator [Neobacillus sp. PS3-34]|uniref:post-transcriptional regulator n=1 Tax=Neobacillus sp. PS3-34 TaxID=3070678 RepID=UPI0027E0EEDD|nr:post-transcriptional regulator [Neobacillus sp. PS3-34]WML47413.1 post-transcriptional regulator [Neobacillus sp. PS3-34]